MNLVLQISPKCGQGGGVEGVKKSQNFADVIYGWPLRDYLQNIQYIADNVLLERDPPDVQCVRCE